MVEKAKDAPSLENASGGTLLVLEIPTDAAERLISMYQKAQEEGKPLVLDGIEVSGVSKIGEDAEQA